MKRMLMAGACVLAALGLDLAQGVGQAADLPVPAVQAPSGYFPATPPTDWAGFYVGLNGGYGLGSSNWTTAAGNSTGGFKTSGGMGGGTLGLNLQTGSVVLGFEGDADWTAINGSSSNAYCSIFGAATCITKNSVLATARARVGYAFDRVLVYATGGGAFGNVLTGFSPPGTFDNSLSFGWTGGAGIEVAFAERWTAKVEYLYLDLDHTACTSANCGPFVPVEASFTQSIIRAGVNFRFAPW